MPQIESIRRNVSPPLSSPTSRRVGSVIVPAHNEAGVIRRCLDALFDSTGPDEFDVTVVCNGCTDETADIARTAGHPVRVIELATASKSAALRAGDSAALGFPRLYVDADVVLAGASARRVLKHLATEGLAARPPLRYDTTRSSALVQSYFRARSRMPAVLGSLWGAGVYGLSNAGHARLARFPISARTTCGSIASSSRPKSKSSSAPR